MRGVRQGDQHQRGYVSTLRRAAGCGVGCRVTRRFCYHNNLAGSYSRVPANAGRGVDAGVVGQGGIKLPGQWENAGNLILQQLVADNGWLMLSYNLGKPSE